MGGDQQLGSLKSVSMALNHRVLDRMKRKAWFAAEDAIAPSKQSADDAEKLEHGVDEWKKNALLPKLPSMDTRLASCTVPTPRVGVGHKVCILMPFRGGCSKSSQGFDRRDQLDLFMAYMDDFFARASASKPYKLPVSYTVLLSEQSPHGLFNKGILFNLAALRADEGCDYFVMHDVDQIPEVIENDYRLPRLKPTLPIHLDSASSQFAYENYKRMAQMVGGALMISRDDYNKSSGMSNKFFGWGREDDMFYTRLTRQFRKVMRKKREVGRYLAVNHRRVVGLDETKEFWANDDMVRTQQTAKLIRQDGVQQAPKFIKMLEEVRLHRSQFLLMHLLDQETLEPLPEC